jgi:putative thioredoxin
VDAFTGVVPEAQLRPWLDQILKLAGGAPMPAPEDPALIAADEALMSGDLDAAEREYKKILAQRPTDAEAEAGLARVGLVRRTQGQDPAKVLSAAEAAPDDLAKQTLAADVELLVGQPEKAYQRLIALVRRSSGEDREKARQHLVSLFAVAGPDDPAVAVARRALASALF